MKFQVALLIGVLAMTFAHPTPDQDKIAKPLENAPIALADEKQDINESMPTEKESKSEVIDDEKSEEKEMIEPMEVPAGATKSHTDENADEEKSIEDAVNEPVRAVRNAEMEATTITSESKPVGEKEEPTTPAITEGKKKDSDESKESNEMSKESVESKEDS